MEVRSSFLSLCFVESAVTASTVGFYSGLVRVAVTAEKVIFSPQRME